MHQQYGATLREAIAAGSQQAALTGRSLTPEEVSAIARGVLTPYLAPYGGGLEEAYEMDLEQQRYEKELAEERELMKQEEKAAETATVGQAGAAAIAGGQLYETYYGGSAAAGSGVGGAGAGAGGGSTTTTSGWGNAFAFVGGGAVGYAASPYGQQAEEGTGGMTRYVFKAIPGGSSRREGQRTGMMAVGGAAGGAATGGNPYGAAGGVIGGFMQENPETGKRGYQEAYSWYIKPAWKGAAHDVNVVAESYGPKSLVQPRKLIKKATNIKKGLKKVKKLL
jgi:hypothetical protein